MEKSEVFELKLTSFKSTPKGVLSVLICDGLPDIYVLEDAIRDIKIKHETCINAGYYEIVMKFSNRYNRLMPFLLDVPNFVGIMIHTGNTVNDTSGCLLVGMSYSESKLTIFESRRAFAILYHVILNKMKKSRVFISIDRNGLLL